MISVNTSTNVPFPHSLLVRRFVFYVYFLAFLSRVTLLCLFVMGAYMYHDGVWKICSMICISLFLKSTYMPSQILYGGPLRCWLHLFLSPLHAN